MDYVKLEFSNVGVQRWRTRTSDITEWASVMREAKALLEGM
jgi:hypothetical protein